MRLVRRWVVAVAVVPLLLAAGCGGNDPKPKMAPSPSSTPTPTPRATPSPAAWEVKSENGADAFVRHWIAAVTATSQTGETRAFSALGTEHCQTCSSIADYVDEVYAEGGSIRVGPWQVLEVAKLAPHMPLARPVISVRVRKPIEIVHRTHPKKTYRTAAAVYTMTFRLVWTGRGWLVDDADRAT